MLKTKLTEIVLRNGLGAHVSSVPPTNLVTFAKVSVRLRADGLV